uniref:Toxin protein n=1 Tax=Hemiscorpius lepturus TaxID=520031 RepID=A0A1L4BJ48_HEMLE|nr:toxin protein [Hemiscorpius lepturus]
MGHTSKTLLLVGLIIISLASLCTGYGESCEAGKYIIPVGQQMNDMSTCTLYKCLNYNRKYVLETNSCATLKLKSGCKKVPGAASSFFPECCPMVVCRG